MTRQKHLKQLVRDRMAKTGESYSTARRRVLAKAPVTPLPGPAGPHLPGSNPATTALRIVLTAAGVRDPHDGQPFTELILAGIAGGIGIGVFSFLYEKEDFASFFIGGRHLWHDHAAYVSRAAERLGAEVEVAETAGARQAERDLRRMLEDHGVCIAWVDASLLPHRCMPQTMVGMAYHVITVYGIDDAAGTALIGDLTDEPVTIALVDLAAARARIRKDRHRLVAVRRVTGTPALDGLVTAGLRACHDGLHGAGAPAQAKRNFELAALRTWSERMRDPSGRESWAHVFQGPRLWRGLTSIHEYIEHYGTGGGLGRPMFGEFLNAAATVTNEPALAELAARYDRLGELWTALAEAALPRDEPMLHAAREAMAARSERVFSGSRGSEPDTAATWVTLTGLERQARESFPMSAATSRSLLDSLADRVSALHDEEIRARDAMADILSLIAV